jgi:glycine oxidase
LARADIGIVGGGLIGLASAWRLAQAGLRVAVYERGGFGGEASWAGAGMLAPGGEIEEPSDFASLALASRALYRAFVRELEAATRTEIDYQECGALDLAYSDDEWRALQHRAERQRALGIASKAVDPKQVAIFWPRVRTENLAGALFYPDDAIVNPRELCRSLVLACTKAAVELFSVSAVEQIHVSPNEATLYVKTITRKNRKVIIGRRFRAAVLAAGAWSSSIPVSGVPAPPAVEPVKGHLVGYQQPDQTCNTILRHGHTYLLQRANGLLIAGASVEHAGWDRSLDPAIAARLASEASFVLPHLAETTPSEIWIGFRPSSDHLQLGPWHSSALHLAYGHFRNGILLAPKTAADLASSLSRISRP